MVLAYLIAILLNAFAIVFCSDAAVVNYRVENYGMVAMLVFIAVANAICIVFNCYKLGNL